MTIKEIINKERWGKATFVYLKYEDLVFSAHNSSLDRIEAAALDDQATLMAQIKLWSGDCKKAEQRIAELEASIDHLRHGGKVQREQINRMEGILNDISAACDEAGREKESPKTITGFIDDQATRIAELEEQVESAYKRGYDAGYTNGFQ